MPLGEADISRMISKREMRSSPKCRQGRCQPKNWAKGLCCSARYGFNFRPAVLDGTAAPALECADGIDRVIPAGRLDRCSFPALWLLVAGRSRTGRRVRLRIHELQRTERDAGEDGYRHLPDRHHPRQRRPDEYPELGAGRRSRCNRGHGSPDRQDRKASGAGTRDRPGERQGLRAALGGAAEFQKALRPRADDRKGER